MQANSLTPFPVVLLVGLFVCFVLFVCLFVYLFCFVLFCFCSSCFLFSVFFVFFFMGGKKEIGNMCCEHQAVTVYLKIPVSTLVS